MIKVIDELNILAKHCSTDISRYNSFVEFDAFAAKLEGVLCTWINSNCRDESTNCRICLLDLIEVFLHGLGEKLEFGTHDVVFVMIHRSDDCASFHSCLHLKAKLRHIVDYISLSLCVVQSL